jgi:2-keto-4-pentenoate hydratase
MTFDPDVIAAKLVRDHAAQRPFEVIPRELGLNTLADAYAVQKAYVGRMQAADGAPAGYKIGLTSRRMQALTGVDHPISGVVLAKRIWASGVHIPVASYGRVGIEFEIGVRLGRDLAPHGRPFTPADVEAAVEGVCTACEIVDDRHSPYPLDLLSMVADNGWNEGMVTGEWRATWPDLAGVHGAVEMDGEPMEQGEGYGRDVLGHPFNSVLWLANRLQDEGQMLRAGEIVSTGSLVTTRFPAAGSRYRFSVDGLGAVEAWFD